MKKIILIVILVAVLIYAGRTVYIHNITDQLAQVSSSKTVTNGTLLTTSVVAGGSITFSLSTTDLLSNTDISNMYIELLGTNVPIYPSKITTGGNNTTILSADIPANTPVKNAYDVILSSLPGKGNLNWYFNESLIVKASSTNLVLPVLTQTDNESEVTGFTVSATQPDTKNPGLFRVTWSGAGRGIVATQIKGGSGFVKQMIYQNTFPIDDSGYKAVSPFFSISGEGLLPSGYSDAQLINASTKPQKIQVTFAPKGKDGSVAPAYAKTVDVVVRPTPFSMKLVGGTTHGIGNTVTAQLNSFWPLTNLLASVRKAPETELYIQKNNTTYKAIDIVEVKSDNTISFAIPNELDVYKNKLGKLEKIGTESVKAGTYTLVLKTVFGITSQVFRVE